MNDALRAHESSAPTGPFALAVLTVSDTRTLADDRSGAVVVELVEAAGHRVADRRIVLDDPALIREAVESWRDSGTIDGAILTGGTGVSPRDRTPEAIAPMLDPVLPGFGELFRALSVPEIGPAAFLSRAIAGMAGRMPVFALPGSTAAVRLGVERLILPTIGHLLRERRKPG